MDGHSVDFNARYMQYGVAASTALFFGLTSFRMIKSIVDIVSVVDSDLGSYGSHMGQYP